jgi:3D (Asp-Asp-Asp) domain-containing protein
MFIYRRIERGDLMAKNRIVCALLSLSLLTPLIKVQAVQTPSEPKQLAGYDKNLDLRNYEIKQVEELIKVEIQKREEIEAKKQEERKKIEETEKQKLESTKQYWKFEVSYYCGCYSCTQNGNLQTASGEYAQEGLTIALPHDIPFGSQVHIDNVGDFVTQDRGGFIEYTYDNEGNLIMRADVFVSDHNRALQLGRHIESGYIIIN